MPTARKIPEGKRQFGIIVPISVHKLAQSIAIDKNMKFSEVYAEAVKDYARNLKGNPQVLRYSEEISPGVDELTEEMKEYIGALLKFLKSNKDGPAKEMLGTLFRQYLSAEPQKKEKRA